MAILIRLLGDDSPLAAQMCEGKIKGAEASDAFLRKDLRVVISWLGGDLINYCISNRLNYEDRTKTFKDFNLGQLQETNSFAILFTGLRKEFHLHLSIIARSHNFLFVLGKRYALQNQWHR